MVQARVGLFDNLVSIFSRGNEEHGTCLQKLKLLEPPAHCGEQQQRVLQEDQDDEALGE